MPPITPVPFSVMDASRTTCSLESDNSNNTLTSFINPQVKAEELETRFDKWLFVLKNLHKLDRIPEKLKEGIFIKLFETAEIAKFTSEESQNYEDSLKYYRDIKNSLDTAREEGENKVRIEMAINSIKEGLLTEMIMKLTSLSREIIEQLRKEITNGNNA